MNMKKIGCLLFTLAVVLFFGSVPVRAGSLGEKDKTIAEATQQYAALLREIVSEDGRVRYDLLDVPRRAKTVYEVLSVYAQADLPQGRNERLAFWCNAFNLNALLLAKMESQEEGFRGRLARPGFYEQSKIIVAGEKTTLKELKDKRIRSARDARLHAALVGGGMTCPPLRAEPYYADRLDEQLDDQCRRWVNNVNYFRIVNGGIGVSPLLKYYADDFAGEPYHGAAGFLRTFINADSDAGKYVLQTSAPVIYFLPGDSSLNQARLTADGMNVNTLTPGEKKQGFRLLFDGTDPGKHWRGFRRDAFPEKGWVVNDDSLHVLVGGGGGDIITVDQFTNFELRLEWRVAPGANSGIMYRVAETQNATWMTGPEYQVLDDAGYEVSPTDPHSAAALYDLYPPADNKWTVPVGEYNRARIIVNHGKVQHWLNGRLVVECDMNSAEWKERVAASKFNVYKDFGKHETGHIALQDHGNNVWYRNIRIRELPDN
ncbi:MAG TPA: DUF1080 domain-containing protein [Phycisphaeraceae bacterium]|nr:DUF1080 domain-containing protein [Phycisphaeraceae bacterium]